MHLTGAVSAFCSEKCFRRKNSNKSRTAKRRIPVPLRATVKDRDAHRCRVCLKKESNYWVGWLNLHHILYRSQGGQNVSSNLISLCSKCHDLMHSNKKRYQPLLIEAAMLAEDGLLIPVLDLEVDLRKETG